MLLRLDLGVGFPDPTVRSDQVADAPGRAGLGVVTRAISHAHGTVGVAQQRKVVVELLREGGVVRCGVEAGADDNRVLGVELRLQVAEPATLLGSTRSVRLGVEPEKHVLAAEIRKADRVAGVVLLFELWGG